MSNVKVTLDNGDVLYGVATWLDGKIIRITGLDAETVDIIICSVNETGEMSWHSEYWGFEYEVTPSNS